MFGVTVKFGSVIWLRIFGPPVFIYSVIQFWSSDPVSNGGDKMAVIFSENSNSRQNDPELE